MTRCLSLRWLAVGLGVALWVAPVSAFKEPTPTEISAKTYRHADLYIGNILVSVDSLESAKRESSQQSLARLGGSSDSARVDRRSGGWGTLITSLPLLPGTGVGNDLTWTQRPASSSDLEGEARAAFLGYLEAHAADLGVDLSELSSPKVTVSGDGNLIQIYVARHHQGTEVRDNYLTAVVSHGNLILLGTHQWGGLRGATPDITREQAQAVLASHLGSVNVQRFGKEQLLYVPMSEGDFGEIQVGEGYSYRLAWALSPKFAGEMGEWEALIDAQTGELLAFEDKANYAASQRDAKGGVFPISNDGVPPDGVEQAGWPMPYAYIGTTGASRTTSTGGQILACLDGTISTELKGPYLEMTDNCGAINETSTSGLDLGTSGGTDCVVPAGHSAGDTHASRSGFYELNKIIEMGRGHLPNNLWLRQPLPSEMNIAQNCNATGGPGGLRFYQSGGGCNNTGELAGVFDHEWGHGMDGADANPGISSPGEGIADTYASLRYNNSCIGRNFRGSACGGYGDPCLSCTGVRDIDYANRVSGNPHDLPWIDANCGSGGGTPCGGSVHCEGAVYAEAVWDLWNREFPTSGMDSNTARETATRLTFAGAGFVGNWYSCVDGAGTGDGCNADGGYLNYIAADDDDGNLSNGTPNMQDIFDAFDAHGIACSAPTVSNSGCAGGPTAAAANLAAVAQDRGASLTWDAVAGATRYKIYRTEGVFGCDFGKTLIGETTGLSFTDNSGLMNGRTYYYSVMGFAASDSCHGAMTACESVVPAPGANLAIDASSIAASVVGGDGDVFFDNCEAAEITFDVHNIGNVALTNVQITSITSPSHPTVVAGIQLPATIRASLAQCGIRTGTARISGSGLTHGETVQVEIEITADELAEPRVLSASIPFVESDLSFVASQTFSYEADYEGWSVTSGTFTRVDGGAIGGSAGTVALNSSTLLPNQCDRVQSPAIVPTNTTTLSLATNFETEDDAGGSGNWYDRANVAFVEGDGSRNAVEPDGGRLYNAVPFANYSGCNDTTGWAGDMQSWTPSTFSAAALGSSGLTNTPVNLEVTYSTDPGLELRGFAFDEVILTNFNDVVPDAQPDCSEGAMFSDGFESGDTNAWSHTSP